MVRHASPMAGVQSNTSPGAVTLFSPTRVVPHLPTKMIGSGIDRADYVPAVGGAAAAAAAAAPAPAPPAAPPAAGVVVVVVVAAAAEAGAKIEPDVAPIDAVRTPTSMQLSLFPSPLTKVDVVAPAPDGAAAAADDDDDVDENQPEMVNEEFLDF